MSTYGQFCPVAMASEVLTERWTPLVIRELLCGSTRFNDLRRGVPLMSPSLLSKRLKTLERVGVIERRPAAAGQAVEYVLTPAGEELRPIIESMGVWGQRWARADVGARQMDASLLMWDIHRNIVVEALPPERVVVFFHLRGSIDKKSRFWLVLQHGAADVCLADPGYEVDVAVTGHVRTMVDYWMGRIEFSDGVRSGDLEVEGPRRLVRALPTWFGRSLFAPVELPEPAGV
jgi:DNA-binding HxlR family transcriptional regulator